MVNFFIVQVSRFFLQLFHIEFAMRQICLEFQFSFTVRCSRFDQRVFLYYHFTGYIFDVFLCIESKNYTIQSFFRNRILFQYLNRDMLPCIFPVHCDIINRNFLSVVFNLKFSCHSIKNIVHACIFLFNNILPNREVIHNRFALCIRNKCRYQVILIVFHNPVSFCIHLSVWCIDGFLCIYGKFRPFNTSHFIRKFISGCFFHSIFTSKKSRNRIYKCCHAIFHFINDLVFYLFGIFQFFSLFIDNKASNSFIIVLFNDYNEFSGFFLYLVNRIGIYRNCDCSFSGFLVFTSCCHFIERYIYTI